MKKLNEAVKRERYVLPSLDDIALSLQGLKVFSKLDAASGFWEIPLHTESSKLTTFITRFGRFCFQGLPFEISALVQNTPNRTSSGRVRQKPKRYIEEC